MPGRQWSAGSLLWNFQPPERGGCDCLLCKPPICLRSLLGAEPREDLCPPLPLCHRHAAVLAGSFLHRIPGTVLPCISGSLPAGESGQVKNTPPSCGGQSGHTRGSPGLTLVFIPASLLALQESR